MARTLDNLLQEATVRDTSTPVIPGVLLQAIDGSGTDIYKAASGYRGPGLNDAPIEFNNTLRIASCTKLITAVAALQCVDRGLIGLDDPVDDVLPELVQLPLVSVDETTGQLKYQPRRNEITLRRLLTHTSGVGYDMIDPTLKRWRTERGEKPMTLSTKVLEAFSTPLIFEPGQGWAYGGGFDWAGVLVERLNGGVDLEKVMEKNIFIPLAMDSTVFRLKRKPHVRKQLIQMASRRPDGSFTTAKRLMANPAVDCAGGYGLYSSITDFMVILKDVLQPQPKLLSNRITEELFRPQLDLASMAYKALKDQAPTFQAMIGGVALDAVDLNVSLGGLLMMDHIPEVGVDSGTITWAGAGGLVWFINRRRQVAGMYATQLMAAGDQKSEALLKAFIKEVWKRKRAAEEQQ
ncbi:uncharacterized protein K452DRAFT_263926 [Aplosporella prunicola CBS 121167]|uniref:Beta-lactamase-related domain-containing protein n=1 Tax=Aplosporella prunicola CBS 121167 TaxID=1176127 RepID=A0A6A6BQG7_9PEZI|nr:uncharacterized protein K452DRAFT_263926 [Aplosporella prunicola CBS 121167]KAF2146250.1 hypothetical protein K452DRAFT_263926 [Aplosporella prunicola CBS 121167]